MTRKFLLWLLLVIGSLSLPLAPYFILRSPVMDDLHGLTADTPLKVFSYLGQLNIIVESQPVMGVEHDAEHPQQMFIKSIKKNGTFSVRDLPKTHDLSPDSLRQALVFEDRIWIFTDEGYWRFDSKAARFEALDFKRLLAAATDEQRIVLLAEYPDGLHFVTYSGGIWQKSRRLKIEKTEGRDFFPSCDRCREYALFLTTGGLLLMSGTGEGFEYALVSENLEGDVLWKRHEVGHRQWYPFNRAGLPSLLVLPDIEDGEGWKTMVERLSGKQNLQASTYSFKDQGWTESGSLAFPAPLFLMSDTVGKETPFLGALPAIPEGLRLFLVDPEGAVPPRHLDSPGLCGLSADFSIGEKVLQYGLLLHLIPLLIVFFIIGLVGFLRVGARSEGWQNDTWRVSALRRTLSHLIDLMLIYALPGLGVVVMLKGLAPFVLLEQLAFALEYVWFIVLLYLFLLMAYFIITEALWGMTLGKFFLGLQVLDDKRTGPCGFRRALIRNLLRPVDAFCGLLPGAALMLLGKNGQRVGDLLAGTVVVRRKNLEP